jgi:hypothetical protein
MAPHSVTCFVTPSVICVFRKRKLLSQDSCSEGHAVLIRLGDGQWAKCDNSDVSVTDKFIEATDKAVMVSKECHFQ